MVGVQGSAAAARLPGPQPLSLLELTLGTPTAQDGPGMGVVVETQEGFLAVQAVGGRWEPHAHTWHLRQAAAGSQLWFCFAALDALSRSK